MGKLLGWIRMGHWLQRTRQGLSGPSPTEQHRAVQLAVGSRAHAPRPARRHRQAPTRHVLAWELPVSARNQKPGPNLEHALAQAGPGLSQARDSAL